MTVTRRPWFRVGQAKVTCTIHEAYTRTITWGDSPVEIEIQLPKEWENYSWKLRTSSTKFTSLYFSFLLSFILLKVELLYKMNARSKHALGEVGS